MKRSGMDVTRFIILRNLQNALRNFEITHAQFATCKLQISDLNWTLTLKSLTKSWPHDRTSGRPRKLTARTSAIYLPSGILSYHVLLGHMCVQECTMEQESIQGDGYFLTVCLYIGAKCLRGPILFIYGKKAICCSCSILVPGNVNMYQIAPTSTDTSTS